MVKKMKEPVSALTHFFALVACIPFLIILIVKAAKYCTVWHVVSLSIFTGAVILLYSASSIYHTLNVKEKASQILRRIDHMMIFVMIAGTYTPVCLVSLRGFWGYLLFGLVWFCAIAGIFLKAFWIQAPRWLSTAIYIIMGWLVLIAFYPLIQNVPWQGIVLLTAGGLMYTIGAVIYAMKRPKLPFRHFGFHEIFHLFVMAGTAFHIVFMFLYII